MRFSFLDYGTVEQREQVMFHFYVVVGECNRITDGNLQGAAATVVQAPNQHGRIDCAHHIFRPSFMV